MVFKVKSERPRRAPTTHSFGATGGVPEGLGRKFTRFVRYDFGVEAAEFAPERSVNALETPRWAWVLLWVLTLGTLAARYVGIDNGLPCSPEGDAVIVWQASYFDRPDSDKVGSGPATYYPLLLARIVDAVPGRSHVVPAATEASLEEHLAAAALPYLKARVVLVVISTLLVFVTFLIARRFFEPGWALCAAALVATSLLDTIYARQARPHAASASMSLLALWAALALFERPTLLRYLLAGLAAALAVGTLHNGAFTIPALFLAHVLVHGRRWWWLAGALALVPLALWLFYPWLFQQGIFAPGQGARLDIGGQELGREHFNGAGFVEIVRGIFGHDPVLIVLAFVGAAIGIGLCFRATTRPRGQMRAKLFVLLGFPVTFTLVWGVMSRVEPRFVVSLIPFLALLAVLALRFIARRFTFGTTASVALALAVLALPAYACGKLFWLSTRTDTFALAAQWIEKNLDRERDRIACRFLCSVPLRVRREGMVGLPDHALNNWERYQLLLPPDSDDEAWSIHWMFRNGMFMDRLLSGDEAVGVARDARATYALAHVTLDERTVLDQTRAGLAEHGTLVTRFDHSDPTQPEIKGGGAERQWRALEVVLRFERLGPPIEIYRLK